jgi:hypothetical protein
MEKQLMIETDKLRKADVFSGTVILSLGLFIIYQAFQMPMKDSYAGVQNVWYVSPALFPLLVGSMLALLGLLLVKTAVSSVGKDGVISVFKFLGSSDFVDFLKLPVTIRYYGIVINLLVFVFLLIPNIDFFVGSILFLLTFFFMFYCGTDQDLTHLIFQILSAAFVLGVYLFSGLAGKINTLVPFSADILVIFFIGLLIFHYYTKNDQPEFKRKFKISLLIGFMAPFTIGIIFKYFLLVPMPYEGLIVSLLDAVWYADIWS